MSEMGETLQGMPLFW